MLYSAVMSLSLEDVAFPDDCTVEPLSITDFFYAKDQFGYYCPDPTTDFLWRWANPLAWRILEVLSIEEYLKTETSIFRWFDDVPYIRGVKSTVELGEYIFVSPKKKLYLEQFKQCSVYRVIKDKQLIN